MKLSDFKLNLFAAICLLTMSRAMAQCPTVPNNSQLFCDIESLMVSNLDAIDNGGGIAWFDTATSTTPLSSTLSLANGENYFADDALGSCGNRQEVTISILGPPSGLNFQGVCVDNPQDATISDLEVVGNNVQWFISQTSMIPLNLNTVLMDETIYYANQQNAQTGCRTSRLSVLVNVGIVPVPEGNSTQQFCANADNIPVISDLVVSGINNWYQSESSASPLNQNTPLIDGATYFASTIDPPCESVSRLAVTVEIITQDSAGSAGLLDICENDTNTYNLFDSLNGSPVTGGVWSPALTSGTGLFDPNIDPQGVFTYTITSTSGDCEDTTASVTVTFVPTANPGTDGILEICANDTNLYDLFDSINGSPETGGVWSPSLTSGTGVFNPNSDSEGIYTYTISNSNCPDVFASVTVNFSIPPNAGSDSSIDICEDDVTSYDLFDSLSGTPVFGGTWSPVLSSGTGVFNPTNDPPGTYTYTVVSDNPECGDESASVTVTLATPPDAGTDGLLELCENDTNLYDLFESLNGAPDTGGTWSPALASGSGLFDPSVDAAGTYSYTLTSQNSTCDDASASVTVNLSEAPDAGGNGTIDICGDDTSNFDLFDSLGGSPDVGGTWSPTLNSGTGAFDPDLDLEGVYTYTVNSTNTLCENSSASIVVNIVSPLSAGMDGTLNICEDDVNSYDLFDSLLGSPDTGGIWSPTLLSGVGIFDPALDLEGIYTYTLTNSTCPEVSAVVIVTLSDAPDAGTNGILNICEDDTSLFNLYDSLNGSPEINGTWSPTLASGTGFFDPTIDPIVTYTYLVSSTNMQCNDASATVTVNITSPVNAGIDGTLEICEDDTNLFNLFDSLNDFPDTGGFWSPALASGSGVFDPSIDIQGTYTYTVESIGCSQVDTSEVIVTFNTVPDITGLTINITNICQGNPIIIDLDNASNIEDGQYNLFYNITGANTIDQNELITFSGGNANFTINTDLFINSGSHEFSIINMINSITNCSADISTLPLTTFNILESITPILAEDGNSFCVSDNATISSLSSNILNAADGATINWYDAPIEGNIYDGNTMLEDNFIYYASILSSENCSSTLRLDVTVNIINCFDDILIPDGFSPNGDTINETFNIKNLNTLYPDFKLSIYNRYGNKLYEGNINTPQWNGVSNSGRSQGRKELPVGVYFFILEFNDGIRKELQGRVYLNR